MKLAKLLDFLEARKPICMLWFTRTTQELWFLRRKCLLSSLRDPNTMPSRRIGFANRVSLDRLCCRKSPQLSNLETFALSVFHWLLSCTFARSWWAGKYSAQGNCVYCLTVCMLPLCFFHREGVLVCAKTNGHINGHIGRDGCLWDIPRHRCHDGPIQLDTAYLSTP